MTNYAAVPSNDSVSSEISCQLRQISDRIIFRDKKTIEHTCQNWLDTGNDLLEAKSLHKHGQFEDWCRVTLNYSKSKAEKLMRAAKLIAPRLKNGTVTDIPPPAVAYQLSAPCLPEPIRDEFIERALKGEAIGPALRKAIRDVRSQKKAIRLINERVNGLSASIHQTHDPIESVTGNDSADEYGKSNQQPAARSTAIALIVSKFGNDLRHLLELVDDVHSNGVFTSAARDDLQSYLTANTSEIATPAKETTLLVTETKSNKQRCVGTIHTVSNVPKKYEHSDKKHLIIIKRKYLARLAPRFVYNSKK